MTTARGGSSPRSFRPGPTERGGLAIHLPDSSETLWVTEMSGSRLIAPVSAGRDPLRGWRSRYDTQFTPAWSTGFEATGVRDHKFRTLFSFGDEPPFAPFDNPFQ